MEETTLVNVPNVGWMNRIENRDRIRYEWAAVPTRIVRISWSMGFLAGLILAATLATGERLLAG